MPQRKNASRVRRNTATCRAAHEDLRTLSTKVVDKFVDFLLAVRDTSLALRAKSSAINF
jgi:hypothetical protein